MFKKFLIIFTLTFLLVGCTNSINLLELSNNELDTYNKFKENYDEFILKDLSPLSICKLYLYSLKTKDYITEYELYTKDKDYVLWSKEEHMNIPEEHRLKDFDIFINAEKLEVNINEKTAYIIWDYKKELDASAKPFRVGFSLTKNKNGIWKVNFMPLQ